jgi:hypothetical protein
MTAPPKPSAPTPPGIGGLFAVALAEAQAAGIPDDEFRRLLAHDPPRLHALLVAARARRTNPL